MNRRHVIERLLFNRLWVACSLAWMAHVPLAHAQLYAREAPPNSAFIHVFNATASQGLNVRIGVKSHAPLQPYTATPFIFLPPGEYPVTAGAQMQSFKLEANHYYTVAAGTSGLKLLEFHEPLSRLRAAIALFNLMTDMPLSLKTADGATPVFEAVAPGTSVQRSINPLQLNLALFSGDRKVADVPAITPQRGQSFSLFVAGTAAAPVLVWNND